MGASEDRKAAERAPPHWALISLSLEKNLMDAIVFVRYDYGEAT